MCFFLFCFSLLKKEDKPPTLFVYFCKTDSLSCHSDIFGLSSMHCMISVFNIVLFHVRGPFV